MSNGELVKELENKSIRFLNLSFRICEALNNDYDPNERVKLLHEITLANNLGFVRLYSFSKRFYSKNGFIVENYRNFLTFRLTKEAKPFETKPRAKGSTFLRAVQSTITYLLKHHNKIFIEVQGKQRLKITLNRDLTFEINELS